MRIMYCRFCGQPLDEGCECEREYELRQEEFMRDYEDDAFVQYGWYQQDIIDLYRRER